MSKVFGRVSLSILVAVICGSLAGCCPFDPLGLFCFGEALPTGLSDITEDQCDTFGDDCFRMSVIGDSIAWGNGLEEDVRIWSRMAEHIELDPDRHVYRQVYAYNGASLGTPFECSDDYECVSNATGEVPIQLLTVNEQLCCVRDLADQDLIIVSGCINDVKVPTIVSPLPGLDGLRDLTDTFCYEEMKRLLETLSTRAPHATVIVLGYFPIFSSDSEFVNSELQAFLLTFGGFFGVDVPGLGGNLPEVSKAFDDRAKTNLQRAVDEVNESLDDGGRFALAYPQFKPENSLFASDPWLYEFDSSWDLLLFLGNFVRLGPADPLADRRAFECMNFHAGGILNGASVEDGRGLVDCIWGSVSHPNEQGENEYYETVLARWETLNDPGGM